MFAIPYPSIDPVLFEAGPFVIRWYALAYLAGLLLGWRYARWLTLKSPSGSLRPIDIDDFLVWATLGVVVGGRLGYILFYKPAFFLTDPMAAFEVWRGGMSFHGGLLGVVIAAWIYAVRRKLPKGEFSDALFCAAPIGLFLGRVANFINGELVGRVTDVPWAMIFPGYGPDPRHPSQLYQAALEGLLLFVILYLLSRRPSIRRRAGTLSGVFLIGYGVFRSIGELFRQPDEHLGFLFEGVTMGQLLSLPMIIAGALIVFLSWRRV
jgi:phosphatidylglycerol:prolipoprotein diacylglycerol transferase